MLLIFRVLESLANFQDRALLVIGNDSTNETTFAFEKFAIRIQNIGPEVYQCYSFSAGLGSIEDTLNIKGIIPENTLIASDTTMKVLTNATASVQLPEDLLDHLNTCNKSNSSSPSMSRRLSYSPFLSDALFQNEEQRHLKLGSLIIAARIRCGTNSVLNTSILTTFHINETVTNHH